MVRFEWDEAKNNSNILKHDVSFQEATLAFNDPASVSTQDRFVDGEPRWQTLGRLPTGVMLLLVHTLQETRGCYEIVRMISARHATPVERDTYEVENG